MTAPKAGPAEAENRPSHTGRQILRNSFWLMTEQGVRIVAGVIVAALVARFLGPDNFGLFNYALSLVAFFVGGVGNTLNGLFFSRLICQPVTSVFWPGASTHL